LSHTFNRLLDRIEASNHELRMVTDSVAHYLKSPITSIRGNLEVALSNGENGNWRESVGEALEGLDSLAQTLNTALDISEAGAGVLRLRREDVELAPLVRQLVDLYQPSMAEHNHIFECDLESNVFVEADRSLLNRMIANLLDNETAHLPRGCSVKAIVRAKDGAAELIIEDDGPGFPPDLRPHVLERFVKGPHSNGHGLGLAFVNAVTQAHGGAVLVADRPGGGAVIELTLPLAKVALSHGRLAGD
jgi:signal transduction histidine kinase